MEVALCFFSVIRLAKKLNRKFHEVKINSGVFEGEIVISCTGLVQAANSLNTAGKNLVSLCSEQIDSPIFKHIDEQRPLLEEGRQVIWDTLKWLNRQVKSYEGSWKLVVMWKWKNMKPFFDWLQSQMDFMLLNILVINSTIELNIVSAYVSTHGLESYPCSSHLKTLKRNIKDYSRQIKKLREVERLREGQLPLGTRLRSSSQKYMRDSMDMIQTLRKSYTPPAAAFQGLESPTTSTSTATSTPSSSTGSSFNSSSTSSSSTPPSASPPLHSSPESPPENQTRMPNPSPRTRSQQSGPTSVRDLRPRSPTRTTFARPQNPGQEQQEPTLIVDSRHNEDVFSYYIKFIDHVRPTRSLLTQINIRIPINIISIYKAQELDLSIQDLEPGDHQRVRYISSKNRTSNWKIVGKTLDVKLYSDSNAHTKPKTLSLFVAHASLDPPIILGQPFLKQSKRNQTLTSG
ncbi:unnamed protein product [Clonostachys byssicola]|uniref:Uncharacterized protein n=1 Tax=Clonostachys byssicola TaxID=160290 RepID=A0A9N9XZZ6_9HYPO|nr:unnamed protein product [Clonostachys byssicola]